MELCAQVGFFRRKIQIARQQSYHDIEIRDALDKYAMCLTSCIHDLNAAVFGFACDCIDECKLFPVDDPRRVTLMGEADNAREIANLYRF